MVKNGGTFRVHYTDKEGERGVMIVRSDTPSQASAIVRMKLAGIIVTKVKLDRETANA